MLGAIAGLNAIISQGWFIDDIAIDLRDVEDPRGTRNEAAGFAIVSIGTDPAP